MAAHFRRDGTSFVKVRSTGCAGAGKARGLDE
jgi:hypothetical protein